jgi:L-glyceraldehyde 3-phosphate reductase
VTIGRVLSEDLALYRDEIVVSSKAGYRMWPGPYGEWGSRKYLLASLDQSLRRMQLEYVDIFYSHRPDPSTPLTETMGALDYMVRQGKALYVGISSYNPEQTREAVRILRELGTPCLIHQPSYSMFNRRIEDGLLDVLAEEGVGCIVFSPLAQGLLTSRYLDGIPGDSRAAKPHGALSPGQVTEAKLSKVRALGRLAQERGQSLAQMALAWNLRHPGMTSVLAGASRVSQIEDNVRALDHLEFSADELMQIEAILSG